MTTVKEIYAKLQDVAPLGRKMDFDNVGFLVGIAEHPVHRILVSLDITDEVVQEAVETQAQLVVSHHPLFFSLKSVTDSDRLGKKIVSLLTNQISAICMHTNLDAAEAGVNDALAKTAGLTNILLLTPEGEDLDGTPFSYGRIGWLSEDMAMGDYLAFIKERLQTDGLRYHDAGRPVRKVAVVGGSGGSYLGSVAAQGCDTMVTADVKYDVFLEAKELGINLIDGDHFCTENVVTPVLEKMLNDAYPEITVSLSKRHKQTARFY